MADENSDVMNTVSRTLLDRVDDKTVSFCARWFWIGITMLILGIDFDGPINALTQGFVEKLFSDPVPVTMTVLSPTDATSAPVDTATLDALQLAIERLESIEPRLQQLESLAHAPAASN